LLYIGSVRTVLRDHALNRNVFKMKVLLGLSSQNKNFSGYVHSAQIIARIRFGIPSLLSLGYNLAKWSTFFKLAENIVHGSAQHAFDAYDLISTKDQILQGIDDR